MSHENKLDPLKVYVNTLIENLNKDIPDNIDLILDGGAFNGGYQLGILIYLKQLEAKKSINIGRISGCSVGAIMGAMYVGNYLDQGIKYYEKILDHYRCNSNLVKLSSLVTEFVYKYVDDVSIYNDKLYINYYNLQTVEQKVISRYKTKDDLIDAIIKSSYIPYVIDGNIHYKGCCDGFLPYIFPENDKQILYIYLQPLQKIKNMLYIKNEENVWPRLLTGIVDINNFFSGVKAEFCSYRNEWTLYDTYIFRIKELFVLIVVLSLNYLQKIIDNIPCGIKNNIYVIRILSILKSLYNDLFRHILL